MIKIVELTKDNEEKYLDQIVELEQISLEAMKKEGREGEDDWYVLDAHEKKCSWLKCEYNYRHRKFQSYWRGGRSDTNSDNGDDVDGNTNNYDIDDDRVNWIG